ncbi:MAG: hypothetical protein GQ470_01340 [Gammaproteobacteria bacterium]|nr:hypothetical protein [Gammaproteobacteria bacterium]
MNSMNPSNTTVSERDDMLNELNDVLHMLDDGLYALLHSPVISLNNAVNDETGCQELSPSPGNDARNIPMEASEVETLVELLIERQLPKIKADMRESVLTEVHRILPNR